ncbi:Protein COBRA [Linum perenne]
MFNFQQYRHIQAPGWTLGWSWSKKEVIWNMMGAQTTEQGDCSKYKGNVPHCCKKTPTVVDLLPGTPYNQQIANCCKGGPGYTCGPAKVVRPTRFWTTDKRRVTQALMTWNVTCTYSQFLAQKTPTCCVSLSSFYNDSLVGCPTCACGCQNKTAGSCTPHLASVISDSNKQDTTPLVQCTSHMCPIRIHWHVKLNYKQYWRVKVTITNFNYRMNYTQWNLVVQHPNFDNLTQLFSFNYKSLTPYDGFTDDTAMLWGVKFFNDFLSQAGPLGNVQSELLFQKDLSTFTFEKGWAFPRRIYFNGDNCVMPSPDAYPWLPNDGSRSAMPLLRALATALLSIIVLSAYA